MQRDLQGIDLTKSDVALPQPVAAAVTSVRDEIAKALSVADPSAGWTAAYSLESAAFAADGGFPGVLRAHYGCPPARRDMVVDGELAL